MRKYLNLLIAASFLAMSQGVIASPLSNREEIAAASPALSGQRTIQTQATSSSPTLMPSDVPPNAFTKLHLLAQTVLVEWMENDPKGTLSLLEVSNGFRRLALPMKGRNDVSVNVSNKLKQHLLAVLIGRQTGDVERFIKDGQLKAFQTLSLPDLQDAFASRYYTGTLSKTTKHGKTYRSIGPEDIKRGARGESALSLGRKNLRLVPLNFPEALRIQSLDLSNNQLRVLPDLSHLTKMWRLDLDSNQLKVEPDLSHLTNLKVLDLSTNQLTVVPGLSHLTNLKHLYLDNNQLTEVYDLSSLTGLTWLDISYNQLRVLQDLSQLTSLARLDLNNNRLTILPDLSRLKNLWRLFLSNNQLTVVPDLSPLTDLKTLCLDAPLCQDATVLETLRMLNRSRVDWNKVKLIACSKDPQGNDVQEEVPLD